MSRYLSVIALGIIILVTSGCGAYNKIWSPVYDGYHQMWKNNDQGRFDLSVQFFKEHLGYDAPVFSLPPREIAEPQSKQRNWLMFHTCEAFLKLRNFGQFSRCVDHFDKINKEMLKKQDYDVDYYARVQILNLKSKLDLSLQRYDNVLENSVDAKNILKGRLGAWENSFDGNVRAQWAWLEIERSRLDGLAYAFSKRHAKARKVLLKLKSTELTNWGSGGARFKKGNNLALAQINMALGSYKEASEALKQYDNIDINGIVTTGSVGFLLGPVGAIAATYNMISAYDEASKNDDLKQLAYYNLPKLFMGVKAGYEEGKIDDAEKGYRDLFAIDDFSKIGEIYYVALHDMGKIQWKRGKQNDAWKYFTKSIEVIESQRSTLNTEASKIGFVGDKQAVYRDIIGLLIQMKRYDEALAYVERGKARAMVDILASKQQFSYKAKQSEMLVANLKSAEDNIIYANASVNSKQRSTYRALLRKRQKDIQQVQPELASLVTVSAPSIADLQKRLPANETLIEYYGDEKQLYAFIMSRNGVGAVKLNTKSINDLISQFRSQINQPKSFSYKNTGHKLYEQLVAPLAKQLKTKNLTIVPHGALHYLPFGALLTPRGYMIDLYNIRVLPSASVMQFLNKQHKPKGTLLVLGNPDLSDKSLDLPGAEQEAIAIAKKQPKAQLLLRNKATETAVKQYGGAYKYLHFASHGVFDPEKPLQSGLLLTKDAANDGNLTVGELYDLNLNADLVTLSACETALGKVANGDDVVGFTRGFLFAGANSIVSSLWKVDDVATNKLMQGFYTNMKKQDKRSALRAAQLSVKKTYQHPYYWAAFQFTGAIN